MKRNGWIYLLSILIICISVIGCKNQYAQMLLKNATYGMPGLIEKGEIDNLYIGSSMFRQGIDILTLEEDEQAGYYILAYNGNQPVLEYYQLKNLLEHGVRIKNLYIDMYAYSAWKEPSVEDVKIFLETDIKTKISIYNLIKSENLDLKMLWNIFVTGNSELLLFWPVNNNMINAQFRNGGTLVKTKAADAETLKQAAAPQIEGHMNARQKLYLEKMIELADDYGINLTFLETPKYQTVSEDEAYLKAMKEYAGLLEKNGVRYFLESHTSEYVMDDSTLHLLVYGFDNTNFEYYLDTVHLSYEGRKKFTQVIKEFEFNN